MKGDFFYMYDNYTPPTNYKNELYHFGVKGMKWGIRRYQNKDGSLTSAGRKRQAKRYSRELNKMDKSSARNISRGNRYRAKSVISARRGNSRKADAQRLESERNYAESRNIDSKTWNKIANVLNDGYNVTVSSVNRTSTAAKVSGILGGALGSMAYTSYDTARSKSTGTNPSFYTPSKSYVVTDNGERNRGRLRINS